MQTREAIGGDQHAATLEVSIRQRANQAVERRSHVVGGRERSRRRIDDGAPSLQELLTNSERGRPLSIVRPPPQRSNLSQRGSNLRGLLRKHADGVIQKVSLASGELGRVGHFASPAPST